MAIDWDVLILEMVMLAAIIYGAVYLENWIEKRRRRREDNENARRVVKFVNNDLRKKMLFIEHSVQYRDYKPFFTDMWDAVILGGRQTLIPFELFENLQHTYSWLKYYNNELEQVQDNDEAVVLETLNEVKGSINQSLKMLKESKI